MSLSMLGATIGQLISLYQTGVIDHLSDPPSSIFDADRVDASEYAYRFNSPDGPMMLVNYGITAWLAAAGGQDRAQKTPLLPLAMGAKILVDAVIATELAREEWNENKAFCEYCQIATLSSFASLALAMPEVTEAVRTLLSRGDQNAGKSA